MKHEEKLIDKWSCISKKKYKYKLKSLLVATLTKKKKELISQKKRKLNNMFDPYDSR